MQMLVSLRRLGAGSFRGFEVSKYEKGKKTLTLRSFPSTARHIHATPLRAELSRDDIHLRHQQMTPAPPQNFLILTRILPYSRTTFVLAEPSPPQILFLTISSSTSIPYLTKSFFPTRILLPFL